MTSEGTQACRVPVAYASCSDSAEEGLAQRYVKALQEDGFCLIENLVPQMLCRNLCHYFNDLFESPGSCFTISSGVGLLVGAVNHAPMIAEYLATPLVIAIAEMLFRSTARISYTTLLLNRSGVGNQSLHADWPFDQTQASYIRSPYFDNPMHLTSLWALTPPDADSGGTMVIPGSHRLTTNPTASGYASESGRSATGRIVLGPEGSALIMDSRLWHGRVQNRSPHSRVVFSAGYSPWWLNLEPLRPGSVLPGLHNEAAAKDIRVPLVPRPVFDQFSPQAKALFAHWI
ncbi:MAG TPA: phytanoyl-CoA dioxygenase family protein [Candidatus Angelobacter sp.]|nr:phytanoyl-CoA dioxygenase family protein [Candidatus Angelobacter sp.]